MILEKKIKEKAVTEKWSVCDKVDECAKAILSMISADSARNAECQKIGDGLCVYSNHISVGFYGINADLSYIHYSAKDLEECEFLSENAHSMNGYDEKNNTLHVTVYSVNGEIHKRHSCKNIVRGVERLLQTHYGMENDTVYKKLTHDAYVYASKKIETDDFGNYAEISLSHLIFYSDCGEQDRMLDRFYNEILNDGSLVTNCNAEIDRLCKMYQVYLGCYEEGMKTDENYKKAFEEWRKFGYNEENFTLMAQKQLKRLNNKACDIRKYFKNISAWGKCLNHTICQKENNVF